MAAVPLLQVQNLRWSYPARDRQPPRPILESISLELGPGESAAIVGARGTGKTTLARAIALVERPQAGRVLVDGRDVTRASGGRLRALRRVLQYVGGDARRALSPRLTLRAILAEPLQVHRLGTAEAQRASVAQAAAAWQLNPYLLDARPGALSAALCLRVALARAQLLGPRLVVCDDLAGRLEPAAVRPLLDAIAAAFRGLNIAWLWTTTDLALARAFAGRIYVLENGRLRLLLPDQEKEEE